MWVKACYDISQLRLARRFTDDDLAVFALAHELIKQGKEYSDVQAALGAGQRGSMPETAVELLPAPVSGQVLALREALEERDAHIKRLQTALDESNGQNKLLERQIKEAQAALLDAYKQIGRLEG